jgi:SAM-dependent methyltransferase
MFDFLRKRRPVALPAHTTFGTLDAHAKSVDSVTSRAMDAETERDGTTTRTNNKPTAEQLIDVRRMISEMSVEELCATAEEYFRNVPQSTYHLAKPFNNAAELAEYAIPFAYLAQSFNLYAGLRVLDFGAGSCWASRMMTQMGCEVVALDPSPSALRLGRELYARQPVAGEQPEPQFLVFDGRRIALADESVDRVLCFDSFHHVPNPSDAFAEIARVLKPGGIAAFAEPGPEHSKSPQSQSEMRLHRVVENDIDVGEIWRTAQAVGFTDIKFAVFNLTPFLLSLPDFEDFLAGGGPSSRFAESARQSMLPRRVFFLYKGEPAAFDSRRREGLTARLSVELDARRFVAGQLIEGRATVTNTSASIWLPASQRVGGVLLGSHLLDRNGVLLELDYSRHALTPGEGRPVQPGETVSVEFTVKPPPVGSYVLDFDLVSESVCWFENNGDPTCKFEIEVV